MRPFPNPHNFPIYELFDGLILAFKAKMSVDADGAPNAYHPSNQLGLDYLGNAGKPGDWWALATDTGKPSGNPLIQQSGEFAGYYISQTSLRDHSKPISDVTAYADARNIPFHVLPGHFMPLKGTGTVGDVGMVFNTHNGKWSSSIWADTGPEDELGEGSIKLAENLGVGSILRGPNKNAGAADGIVYLLFPKSKPSSLWPLDVQVIDEAAQKRISEVGGMDAVKKCLREARLIQ